VCNRFNQRASKKEIADLFAVGDWDGPAEPGASSVWPMRDGLIVRPRSDGGPGREASALRWGLVPFWADDPKIGRNMTNARCETVATKPAFRAAFKSRRCLIPATGFCEWKAKVWYEFTVSGRPLLGVAGLWEQWDKGDAPLFTFTMVTCDANPLVAEYHVRQRMPVIIEVEHWQTWLTGTPDQAGTLLRTYPADRMEVRAAA
jgi:putative SOS response-associated peptidase YedK